MNSSVVIDFIARTPALRQGTGQVVQSLDSVERAMKRVRQAMFVGGAAVGGGLAIASRSAIGFEADMRNVNSIVQDTDKVFSRTSNSVLQLATQIPRSARDLAQGAYQVVSAGFTQPQQMLDILKQSGMAASAGLTNVNTAATAVVTTMNAYGAAAGNATRVSDLLFQTVNVGQVSFEQLATNLGDFIGIAAAGGGTLAETLSAYSSITIATGQASRSATSLQGIYRQLIKPSETLKTALAGIGAESGRQAVQMYGLQGTLDKLSASVGGSEVAMAAMFQDVEGLNGVLALTGPNAEKARQNLAKFTNESEIAGATARAMAEQQKSVQFQLGQLRTSFGALGIQIGQNFIPFIRMGVTVLQTMVDMLNAIPAPVRTLLAFAALAAAAFGTFGITVLAWHRYIQLATTAVHALKGTQLAAWLVAQARASGAATMALTIFHRQTLITAAGLKTMGLAAGALAASFLIIPPLARGIQNMLNPQNIDAMTESLYKSAEAWQFQGRVVETFGGQWQGLSRDIKTFTRENKGIFKSFNLSGVEPAIRRVDELDKSLAQLVGAGNINMAQRLFAEMEKEMSAAGLTAAEIRQAFNDYFKAVGQVELQNLAAADAQYKMNDAVESAGDKAKKAKEDADAYKESIKELSQVANSFFNIQTLLGKVEDRHRTAYDNAEKARQALERQRDRAKEVSKAQDDMARAQERVNTLSRQQPIPGTSGWDKLRDAQSEVADAADRLRGSQEKVNAEYKKTAPTINEVSAVLEEQLQRYRNFQKNLTIAAARGVPIEVIRELQKMGEEGVEMAALLASAPPKEFDKLRGQLAEKQKIESEAFQKQLDHDLVVAAAIARTGAHATYQAIIEEIQRIVPGLETEESRIREAMVRLGLAAGPPIPFSTPTPTSGPVLGPPIPGSSTDPANPENRNRKIVGPGVRIMDSGGIVHPGINVIDNRTHQPEYVLNAAQMQRAIAATGARANLDRPASIQQITHEYKFGDIYAQDLNGAMRQADQKKRLAALAGG